MARTELRPSGLLDAEFKALSKFLADGTLLLEANVKARQTQV